MAYQRVTWVDGQTALSAEHMNNIEDGIEELKAEKADKVEGKGLSTNDYTTEEKTKLAGIAAGAQVNPGEATTSTAGLMSAADKTNLNNISAGGSFVVVNDSGTISTLAAGSRMAYSINLATEYNIPTDGSHIPIGFLKIYPQFTDDKCVIQAFDMYTDENGRIKAVINICNFGTVNYTNVSMQVRMLLWKTA